MVVDEGNSHRLTLWRVGGLRLILYRLPHQVGASGSTVTARVCLEAMWEAVEGAVTSTGLPHPLNGMEWTQSVERIVATLRRAGMQGCVVLT